MGKENQKNKTLLKEMRGFALFFKRFYDLLLLLLLLVLLLPLLWLDC